uniref:Zonadhesin n=1 Tax=Fundulus heteroclitus TaxID=8078 RepID=A0A3Q2TJU8_FUNHE
MLGVIHADLLITVALVFLICDPLRDDPSRISPSGVCTIHSNTDCHTFDGVVFRFMSPCTYVLAKTCSASEPLPKFYVEVVNVYNDNGSLPTIQQINVDLGTFRVSLLKSETRRAVVNGVWKRLPLSLNNDTINVKSNPVAVVVGSSSGVSVSYDNTGAVEIRIPLEYSDRVCGLCGNFNQLPGDDLLKPDGTNAESATALAESWRTGGNVSSCETIKVPQQCNPLDKAHYSSEKYCGLLRSSSGPFSSCLPVVGAEGYFRACLLGLCSGHGDKVLCETLEGYADVCQKAGIDVPAWRNSTFCSLECDENSHYNSCASGCPEVCSSLDQTGLCGNCEERCECNPGFKFSGDKCVPAEDCGCWYKGKHYKRGATTVEGDCVQRCQCIGNDGMLCTAMKCASDEVCKEKNGIKDCFPFKPATCSVYGDPHYVTFDKLAYDFQGGCAYTLTTTCGGHATVQFTVIGFNIHPADQNFTRSKLEAVALQLGGLNLTLNQSGEVNGDAVRLPYSTNGSYGSVWVYVKKGYTILETTFGLKMVIDGQSRLFLQVDERFKYELCGLCGTYSGYQEDDFVMPGGNIAVGSFEFGNSWIMHANEGCTTHPNDPRECVDDEKNMANEECSMVFKGAFEACHEHVHPSIYFSSCVYDYCATSGSQFTLCESLKSYATACFVEGVELSHWQTGTPCVCPINCNFDTNVCEWEQLMQDSFDWTRHSGSTPTNLTGPNQDHTTGDGHYIYIEASSVTYGDTARLISSECTDTGPLCLQFWYHMYGSADTMGLNIYLLQNKVAKAVWQKRNSQGNMWHLAQVDLNATEPFQILFEGRRGSNDLSDVAIDDITLDQGRCSGKKCTSVKVNFQLLISVCELDCDFEQDLCQWSQLLTDVFDWERQNGSTPTSNTGPLSDHTTGGSGHYLYIEANRASLGDTARLVSAECSDAGPQCLMFWYHMYGSADTMGIHVYLLQDRHATVVWRRRNDQGNMWHLAQVDLVVNGTFQVVAEVLMTNLILYDTVTDLGKPANMSTTNAPHVPATTKPGSQPSPTAGQHPTVGGNVTARPQVPATTKPVSSNETGPQPSPTAGPRPPTAGGNVTAGPQVPATTKPVSSNETNHYTTCIPACSPTCKHLNGPPNCNAEKTCASGCVCDDGFAQKGSICLPVQKCGCMDRNGTYHNFREVWYTDHCTQKCECEEDDDDEGKIDCEDKDGCEGDAVCLQHEMGQYYCESTGFGECTIQGDPEYKTFDKLKHDFSGSNLYVLVRTKNLPKNLPEIYIEGTNTCTDEDSQSDDSSEESIDDDTEGHGQRLQELKIKVYNHTVELKHKRKVLVDGQRIEVPGSSAPGFEIKMQSSHIYLKTDFGLSVEFNGHCKTDIILPFLYKRRIEGLCGNFDGRKANDKVKPDGTIAKNTKEFGESWRV